MYLFPAPTAVAHQNLFFHFAHSLYSLEPSTKGNIQGVFFSVIHLLFSKASVVVVEIGLIELKVLVLEVLVVVDVNLMVDVTVVDSIKEVEVGDSVSVVSVVTLSLAPVENCSVEMFGP